MKISTRAISLFLILFYVSTYVNISYAQTSAPLYSLKGSVYETAGTSAIGANVQLVRAKDSSLVKIDLSNTEGKYAFENIAEGSYKLKITYVGFVTYWSESVLLNKDTEFPRIMLKAASSELKEVTVTANKPLIEQQMDKLVLNVAGSIAAAGSTALEVLEKAPGIRVDQNDNISMRGKQGVMVMIDGKRVPMSGSELANMLRGMSADAIEKIDLITNPSAKYDAAGNAGIIDIRLKKDKRNGTNGNLSLSYGQGRYGKSNDGLSINHRNKNLNVFGSYNYVFRKDYTALDLYRRFFDTNNAFSGAYNQDNNFKYTIHSNNARLGMDYYLGKKTIIGFSANGILTGVDRNNQNISEVLNTSEQKASSFLTDGRTASDRKIGSLNLNFKHTLDSAGSELNADIDVASYGTKDDQHYTTKYYDLNNAPTQPAYLLFGDLGGQLDIRSAKIDYTRPFKSGLRLEAGAKSSLVEADNDLKFFDQSGGGNILDVSKSNHFIYKENINALYLNASKKWAKSGLQIGLRLENTNADGNQVTTGERFKNSYSQFFPSAAFTHKINKANDIGITLSRRINRPTYNQLNPFKYFLDPSTYSSGNPFLKPQTSYSFEITHTINQKYMITYGYSHTTDNIISVLSPAPGQDKVTI